MPAAISKTSDSRQFCERQADVTIILASYGRLEYLRAAVESALAQSYPDFQVLVVDDGSNDEVLDWLRQTEAQEPRLSVSYRPHLGVAKTRAQGVALADTEFICILDSDDLLHADALQRLIDAMLRAPGTELVFTDTREIRSNAEALWQRYRQFDNVASMTLATLLRPRVPFKHSGTLFRRSTALELGSYDENLSCKVDVDLYLKFLRAGYLPLHVVGPLVDFRMHKNSVSINRLEGIKVWMYLIDEYGPRNPLLRSMIKTARIAAELMKRLYLEIVN